MEVDHHKGLSLHTQRAEEEEGEERLVLLSRVAKVQQVAGEAGTLSITFIGRNPHQRGPM